MNTAVLISGQPREVAVTWKSWWHNLILNFPNPHVFIYTDKPYPVEDDFFQTVQPKKYVVQGQRHHPEHKAVLDSIKYVSENHKNSMAQQHYGQKMCVALCDQYIAETGTTFDIGIRFRPDHLIIQKITPDLIELDKINTLRKASCSMMCELCISNYTITRDFNNIYDWIITKAASTCPDDCWRIQEPPYFWTSDTLMARYMLDYKEHKHAESEKILNAHSYYRIMRIFHQYGNVKDI